MSRAATRARFSKAQALLLVASAAVASCAPRDEERRIAMRLTDLVYAADAAAVASTAHYPRATLGDQTRPVLAANPPENTLTRTHATVTVGLPEHAHLELGYGLEGDVAPTSPVNFTITARTGASTRTVFAADIAAAADMNAWRNAVADLEGLSGEVVLEFATAAKAASDAASPTAVYFSEPIVTVPADARDRRPSLVLISIDALRADHLGIYGYAHATSPNIDRVFSSPGVVVDRYYTNAADTLRGHTSMLTGHLPTTALEPGEASPRIADWAVTLAEYLRANRYHTAAFTEGADLATATGFARGFELYDDASGGDTETPGRVEQTFARGLAWLRGHAGEPAFLFLHTDQARFPYDPPAQYDNLFPAPAGASQSARDAADYDREIRYTDEQFGMLVDELRKARVLDDVLLVVTSDHGEELGEHGRIRHGANLYDEVLRVPLLMRLPEVWSEPARRPGPMASSDLVPTLGVLLGFTTPDYLEGQNMAPHLREGVPVDPIAIYHEARSPIALTPSGEDPGWIPPSFALTSWPRRLSRINTPAGARYEMYDLSADPAEKTDIYAKRAKSMAFLRARLDRYDEFRSQRRKDLAATAKTSHAEPSTTDTLDEERHE